MADYFYPFDPTGKAVSNLIQNERQTISPPNWTDYYFVIPKLAPYYRNSLRVIHRPSGKVLVEGQDYICTHFFHDATFRTTEAIYGSITLMDPTLTGLLELTYQTVGGEWVLDDATILKILSNTLMNPRIVTWEQVVELPHAFPPTDHKWDLDNLRNMDDVVESLNQIGLQLQQTSDLSITDHINSLTNPHQVTKTQVGLGNVPNYSVSDLLDAIEGIRNDLFMTPLRTREAISNTVGVSLNEHIIDTTNPHQVTKTQVGLGLVENYPVATQAEAEEGLRNDRYMTPLRTEALLEKFVETKFEAHVGDFINPHRVNKVQVGLGNVSNLPLATLTEVQGALSNDHYMTPLRTSQMISFLVKEAFDDHAINVENPHQVTKTQVGLGAVENYFVSTQAEAEEGLRNDRYMTPLRTREAITAVANLLQGDVDTVGSTTFDHINDTNNPHNVTAEQIGTYTQSELQTFLALKADVEGTIRNSQRLEGFTLDEVDNYVNHIKSNLIDGVGAISQTETYSFIGFVEVQSGLGKSTNARALVSGFNGQDDFSLGRDGLGVLNVVTDSTPTRGSEFILMDGDLAGSEFYTLFNTREVQQDGIISTKDIVEIWVKQIGTRNGLTVISLDRESPIWNTMTLPTVTEPPVGLIKINVTKYIKDVDIQTINGGTF